MATLLYRLGLGAARRPLLVILAWVLALALAVGGFLAFGGTLSSTVTIPGTPTAQVTDRLKEEFPEASRGRGQVVFTTEDGSPLTDAQREQITAARPLLDLAVWLELETPARRTRALARDGETFAPHWDRWAAQEEDYLARHAPRAAADLILRLPSA